MNKNTETYRRSKAVEIDPKRAIKRDHVVSIVRGQNRVGVYYADTDGSKILYATTPQLADKAVKRHNMLVKKAEALYIIVGDNNFWYTTFRDTEKGAVREAKRIKRQIETGIGAEFDEPSEACTLHLYEVKEIERVSIDE